MAQIMQFVGSRHFRSKLDLADGYHNVRIYAESVKDATFCCQMAKYHALGMHQGDCNTPATMMRAMNVVFRNIQDLMMYHDDILIDNHTYGKHIKTIKAVIKIGNDNKL